MTAALAAWRTVALQIVTMEIASTESQRALAWRFLRQWRRVTV